MKHNRLIYALAIGGLLVAAGSARGHHPVAAESPLDKPIEFSGTVVRMEFVNPHSMLVLEVTNPDGSKTVWRFQTGATTTLRRLGLVKPSAEGGVEAGDQGTATGFVARGGNPPGV